MPCRRRSVKKLPQRTQRMPAPAPKSDLIRYALLYHHGGLQLVLSGMIFGAVRCSQLRLPSDSLLQGLVGFLESSVVCSYAAAALCKFVLHSGHLISLQLRCPGTWMQTSWRSRQACACCDKFSNFNIRSDIPNAATVSCTSHMLKSHW